MSALINPICLFNSLEAGVSAEPLLIFPFSALGSRSNELLLISKAEEALMSASLKSEDILGRAEQKHRANIPGTAKPTSKIKELVN